VEETLKFLFWNIQKKPLGHLVRALVDEHDIDIVILAEGGSDRWEMLHTLNRDRTQHLFHTDDLPDPMTRRRTLPPRIYGRFAKETLVRRRDDARASFYELVATAGQNILLVVVHLPSRLRHEEHDQAQVATRIGSVIREEEALLGHQRTVVIGDFNMNPFDKGVMTSDAFHAVMTQATARRGSRTVDAAERAFFYNPMWGCLGDRTPGPPGTYYYDSPGQLPLFWNTFDLVLIRPELLDFFDTRSLQILDRAGNVPLLTPKSKRPDRRVASDHLPILFSLHL
jgi:endonuclease/exonuclease/phosphatase family metal-dependent hydrolase